MLTVERLPPPIGFPFLFKTCCPWKTLPINAKCAAQTNLNLVVFRPVRVPASAGVVLRRGQAAVGGAARVHGRDEGGQATPQEGGRAELQGEFRLSLTLLFHLSQNKLVQVDLDK